MAKSTIETKKANTKKKYKTMKTKKKMPDWASALFSRYVKDMQRLRNLVELSERGIVMLHKVPDAVQVLVKYERDNSSTDQDTLKHSKMIAKLARREMKTGFTLLHSWAIVGMWAHLESVVRTLVQEWLKHKPSSWRVEPIGRLKIKLGEYESIPRAERYLFVAEQLERELAIGLRSGVTKFEAILEPFGLSGDVPDNLRRAIYELGQVRNLIVHRSSRVDKQFVAACPWLDQTIGKELSVTTPAFMRYAFAAIFYTVILKRRVGEKYGVDMSKARTFIDNEHNRKLLGENAPAPR